MHSQAKRDLGSPSLQAVTISQTTCWCSYTLIGKLVSIPCCSHRLHLSNWPIAPALSGSKKLELLLLIVLLHSQAQRSLSSCSWRCNPALGSAKEVLGCVASGLVCSVHAWLCPRWRSWALSRQVCITLCMLIVHSIKILGCGSIDLDYSVQVWLCPQSRYAMERTWTVASCVSGMEQVGHWVLNCCRLSAVVSVLHTLVKHCILEGSTSSNNGKP